MRTIVQDSYLEAWVQPPLDVGGDSQVMAPWELVAYTLPAGLWLIDWCLVGENQPRWNYDLAICSMVNPPAAGVKVSYARQYAHATEGRALVQGPAEFWVKQSVLNGLGESSQAQVGLKFWATELSEVNRPGPLTNESAVGLVRSLEAGQRIKIFPYFGEQDRAWYSSRFALLSGKWFDGSAGNALIIEREAYGVPQGSYRSTVLGQVQWGGPFAFESSQADLNPETWNWGYLSVTGTLKALNLVYKWERSA